MRSLCVAVGLALCSSNVLAADFGIGISARSDDGYLYAPIDISKTFRLEPFLRYGTSELSYSDEGLEDTQDTETLELGVGVFAKKQVTDAAHIYFGARLAYVDTESTVVQPGLFDVIRSESTQDGYRIGPTLGFEYIFGGHFSVGGEASYTFLDLEGESRAQIDDFELSKVETKQKSQGTQTRLIFRYMF
jgi:opacity protein-like surface antigen